MDLNSADLNSAQEAHLRELLDAVRPGSDDLSRSEFAELAARLHRDPQFKELAARSQRFDQAISDAMHDLPIPAGSVDRLLARLDLTAGPGKQGVSTAITSSEVAAPRDAAASAPAPQTQSRQPSAREGKPSAESREAAADRAPTANKANQTSPRRTSALRLLEVGVLAIAASLAVVAYLFSSPQVAMNADKIVMEVQAYAANDTAVDWQPLPANQPPARLAKFAFASGNGLTVNPKAWREVHDLLGRSGLAFDLRSGGGRATLYVVELDPPTRNAPRFDDLHPVPPVNAQINSRNKALAAWSHGDLLYVLVVDGGPQQYKAFVEQPGRLAAL